MDVLNPIDPIAMLKPKRKVIGMSAMLLPFADDRGSVDWPGFRAHLKRTANAGLTPAVNMDTGYASMLDDETRKKVLEETVAVMAGRPFVAGVFVSDKPGDRFQGDAYQTVIDQVEEFGGMPIIFQSHGLTSLDDDAIIDAYQGFAKVCERFLAFELGGQFAPFGRIYSLEVYHEIMKIKECLGAKHSSLDRELEWSRLALRDQHRPGFLVLTGNDLGIDMIMWGSDYLLGLSTFAPDAFAVRDALWERGDPAFFQVNDVLQYLGAFAFRVPVPAYKHSAAQFLEISGHLKLGETHPRSPRRPDSDREILEPIAARIHDLVVSGGVA